MTVNGLQQPRLRRPSRGGLSGHVLAEEPPADVFLLGVVASCSQSTRTTVLRHEYTWLRVVGHQSVQRLPQDDKHPPTSFICSFGIVFANFKVVGNIKKQLKWRGIVAVVGFTCWAYRVYTVINLD